VQRFLAIAGAGSGDRNLLDAALDAGFGSYAQFFRVFRQEMGTTPRLWAAGCRLQVGSQGTAAMLEKALAN